MRLYLTGRLTVVGSCGSFDDRDLPGNQARVTLAALILDRSPISRDRLADIVWGEELPAGWNGSLNALVSRIRTLLDGIGLNARETLRSAGGSYQLVLPARSWVDAEDAVSRLDKAEGSFRNGATRAALAEATAASAVLCRPVLSGSEGEWIHVTRQRLNVYLYRCYEVLAQGWRIEGDDRLAAAIAEKAIGLDPYRETAYRLLMEAELVRGDSAAALAVYERCERMAKTEFGATPSLGTAEVAERARRH